MPRPPKGKAAALLGAVFIVTGLSLAGGLLALATGAGQWALHLAAAAFVVGATTLWMRLTVAAQRERQLERLVSGFEAAAGATAPRAPSIDRNELDPLLLRLHNAARRLVSRLTTPADSEARLAAIMAALPQPVVVITEQGLVSLANQAAIELMGKDRLEAGTSVFDAIERSSLAELLLRLQEASVLDGELRFASGGSRRARVRSLPEHGGAVIVLEGPAPQSVGMVQALDLHEMTPPRLAPVPQTPLDQLTVMVLDCESTGLNVGFDRLLSLAAVRVQGARLVRGETVDVLFDPGEPIPPASTAIHGITDAMAMAEPPLAQRWPEIEPMLRDCVIVGHNIGFDLTLLETELRRAGIRWHRPLSLCTVQLTAALDPSLTDLNLETVARTYGIPVAGRHTALGDALVTAEVYLHLLALMQAQGDHTLADAQARATTARRVIRQQEAAGW
jgi:DNA polymerase-3 subunit epsilon